MHLSKHLFLFPILFGALILAGALMLWPGSDANAQCGSQASSCKNCHEVQGQAPVNSDGTGWHQGHSFGDFCYICHAGNNQSMDKDEAHTSMVPPLSDVNAACQSCHYKDLMERAEVYATALGMEIGTGGGPSPSEGIGEASGSGGSSPSSSPPVVPAEPELVVEPDDLIDYNQQYNETVLGQRTINWGNRILTLMIVIVSVGGGGIVYYNERKLRGLPPLPIKKIKKPREGAIELPEVEGYSLEVVALLPQIAQLNPVGLQALKRILENPDEASELLYSLSRLDPELVRRIRSLDRESRALLFAFSGD